MRRIATVFTALALTGAFATGALADSSTPATMGMAPGAVIVAACHPSPDVTTRFATFVGEMRSLPGTWRMAMRFTLLERLGTPDFTAVGLPDLRPWRRSKKGASSFIFTQRVTALHDGGTYRMRVQMRWYGSDGRLMKVRTMRSGACKQPAPLPNLRISSISTAPGSAAGTTNYMVTVQNDGAGDAGPVVVGLRVDGGTLETARVPTLASGQAASVKLTGPACGATLRAIADPGNAIRETSETDNALVEACPA
jgi:CARDB